MESLDPGENVVGTFEPPAHTFGHLDLFERSIQDRGVGFDKLLRLVGGKDVDVERSPLLLEECRHHVIVSLGQFGFDGVLGVLVKRQRVVDRKKNIPISAVQPHIVSGAQSKKGYTFFCCFLSGPFLPSVPFPFLPSVFPGCT